MNPSIRIKKVGNTTRYFHEDHAPLPIEIVLARLTNLIKSAGINGIEEEKIKSSYETLYGNLMILFESKQYQMHDVLFPDVHGVHSSVIDGHRIFVHSSHVIDEKTKKKYAIADKVVQLLQSSGEKGIFLKELPKKFQETFQEPLNPSFLSSLQKILGLKGDMVYWKEHSDKKEVKLYYKPAYIAKAPLIHRFPAVDNKIAVNNTKLDERDELISKRFIEVLNASSKEGVSKAVFKKKYHELFNEEILSNLQFNNVLKKVDHLVQWSLGEDGERILCFKSNAHKLMNDDVPSRNVALQKKAVSIPLLQRRLIEVIKSSKDVGMVGWEISSKYEKLFGEKPDPTFSYGEVLRKLKTENPIRAKPIHGKTTFFHKDYLPAQLTSLNMYLRTKGSMNPVVDNFAESVKPADQLLNSPLKVAEAVVKVEKETFLGQGALPIASLQRNLIEVIKSGKDNGMRLNEITKRYEEMFGEKPVGEASYFKCLRQLGNDNPIVALQIEGKTTYFHRVYAPFNKSQKTLQDKQSESFRQANTFSVASSATTTKVRQSPLASSDVVASPDNLENPLAEISDVGAKVARTSLTATEQNVKSESGMMGGSSGLFAAPLTAQSSSSSSSVMKLETERLNFHPLSVPVTASVSSSLSAASPAAVAATPVSSSESSSPKSSSFLVDRFVELLKAAGVRGLFSTQIRAEYKALFNEELVTRKRTRQIFERVDERLLHWTMCKDGHSRYQYKPYLNISSTPASITSSELSSSFSSQSSTSSVYPVSAPEPHSKLDVAVLAGRLIAVLKAAGAEGLYASQFAEAYEKLFNEKLVMNVEFGKILNKRHYLVHWSKFPQKESRYQYKPYIKAALDASSSSISNAPSLSSAFPESVDMSSGKDSTAKLNVSPVMDEVFQIKNSDRATATSDELSAEVLVKRLINIIKSTGSKGICVDDFPENYYQRFKMELKTAVPVADILKEKKYLLHWSRDEQNRLVVHFKKNMVKHKKESSSVISEQTVLNDQTLLSSSRSLVDVTEKESSTSSPIRMSFSEDTLTSQSSAWTGAEASSSSSSASQLESSTPANVVPLPSPPLAEYPTITSSAANGLQPRSVVSRVHSLAVLTNRYIQVIKSCEKEGIKVEEIPEKYQEIFAETLSTAIHPLTILGRKSHLLKWENNKVFYKDFHRVNPSPASSDPTEFPQLKSPFRRIHQYS
jgi:hypothetical protein